jgi:hypothetical protein
VPLNVLPALDHHGDPAETQTEAHAQVADAIEQRAFSKDQRDEDEWRSDEKDVE